MEKEIFALAKNYELWSVVGVFLIAYIIRDKKETIKSIQDNHDKVIQDIQASNTKVVADLKEDKERLYKVVDEHGQTLEKLHQTQLKVAEISESTAKRMEKIDLELAVLKAQYTKYTGSNYSIEDEDDEELKG